MSEENRLYELLVIGASAGGVEALTTVLAMLPETFPLPIVVAQHLYPERPSHLADILGRVSRLPVRAAADGPPQPLEPGVVYVVPPDRDAEVVDHVLSLRSESSRHPHPSIDLLLSSAAGACGEQLIALILSGTGTDGAAGARAVKVAGGTVVIQDPRTAAYPGMPAAVASTAVDLVVDLEQLGPLLLDLATGVPLSEQPDVAVDEALDALLVQVHEHSGIDFTSYKHPTILRRLQRRLMATKTRHLAEYRAYLGEHPEEYRHLVASFLITVTEFFRDTELWTALRTQVLPELIAHARAAGHELRFWSAGCATGEEAYSLAILLMEVLGDELEQFDIRIFATDVDANALRIARRGIYPAEKLATVPSELIARYFIKLDGQYEIAKRVRGLTIFGVHDLGARPPFPRIDLVLCRNVLIYFTSDLQARALQLFAYALRDGGYLALGKAETPAPLTALFAPLNPGLKLFRRQGQRVPAPSSYSAPPTSAVRASAASSRVRSRVSMPLAGVPPPSPPAQAPSRTLGSVMLELPLGMVVVDREYDIQAANAAALHALGIYRPAVGKDLFHLAEGVPVAPLRRAIDAAFGGTLLPTGEQALKQILTVETELGQRRELQITCVPQPAEADDERAKYVVLLVEDLTGAKEARSVAEAAHPHDASAGEVTPSRQAPTTQDAKSPTRAWKERLQRAEEENARLQAQLVQTTASHRTLLEANQELTRANLDLRSAYDELLVSQEVEQVSAEEVKTLNEEMQSSNEELETVNEELEASIEELRTANDDLQTRTVELQAATANLTEQRARSEAARRQLEAILLSMGDALLVVSRTGDIILTNAAYARMFGDPGLPLQIEDEEGKSLSSDATPQRRATGDTSFTMTFTMTAADGSRRWFEAWGEPIRSDGEPQGGVVTIRDITDRSVYRLQQEFTALASHELRGPLSVVVGALQIAQMHLSRSDAGDQAKAKIGESLAMAQWEADRMMLLVNDLLDMRRLQTGKLKLRLEPVDLVPHVRRTVAGVKLATAARSVVLDVKVDSLLVMGDASRLEQILLNLLNNAIQHATHAERIEVRLREVNGAAELQVQDDGPGIPPHELSQIFSRYYQVARPDQHVQTGLGLGLYITKELVTLQGGTIDVESQEGVGTRFTIELPTLREGGAPQTVQATDGASATS